jgi:hypothetical protein
LRRRQQALVHRCGDPLEHVEPEHRLAGRLGRREAETADEHAQPGQQPPLCGGQLPSPRKDCHNGAGPAAAKHISFEQAALLVGSSHSHTPSSPSNG